MTVFWVLVFQEPSKKYIVRLTSVVKDVLHTEPSGDRLLYMRMFTTMQDGVGHKLYLEGLSTSSLRTTIRTINPQHRDIRPLVEQFNAENNEIFKTITI